MPEKVGVSVDIVQKDPSQSKINIESTATTACHAKIKRNPKPNTETLNILMAERKPQIYVNINRYALGNFL